LTPIKPDSKDADFGTFSAILRHRPPVLAHSTDALIIFDPPTDDRRRSSYISRSGVPKSLYWRRGYRLSRCLGLVVDPHSIGRGLLRDRKGRRWTQIAAQAAFFYHQFQTLHWQRAGTGQ
jgi:hypothetical protein